MFGEVGWAEKDKARRRKSEVTGVITNFLERSALTLTRTKSQDARTRRAKGSALNDMSSTKTATIIQGPTYATGATSSRLPMFTTASGTVQSTARTVTYNHIIHRPSTVQPASPSSPSRYFTTTTPHIQPSTSPPRTRHARPTSPQAPSRGASRIPQSPTSPTPSIPTASPTSFRPIQSPSAMAIDNRPSTPSSSSSRGKKMFGMLLPSSNASRKNTTSGDVVGKGDRKHHPRSGSGSSHEPLLPTSSRTSSDNHHHHARGISHPVTLSVVHSIPESRPKSPPRATPSLQHRSKDVQSSSIPTTRSTRSTPVAPLSPSTKGKQRAITPVTRSDDRATSRSPTHGSSPVNLAFPQPRAPVTFLPQSIPRLHRTPPTPQKRQLKEEPRAPRVDSFMSDSMPIPQLPESDRLTPPNPDISLHSRHPAFVIPSAQPIERSKSAPAAQGKGRSSPCLRIPSPRFFNKDGARKERKVTPESVGSPILRETRIPPSEKPPSAMARLSQKVRRTTHGSFDFERPGSRGSSKSAYSEPKSARSDEGKEKPVMAEKSRNRFSLVRHSSLKRDIVSPEPQKPAVKYKTTSPVPPLPVPRPGARSQGAASPLPRTRSPPRRLTVPPSPQDDDSTLPRLASSLGRRATTKTYNPKAHSVLPSFAFERPIASARVLQDVSGKSRPSSSSKTVSCRGSGPLLDTNTGLMWRRATMKENTIPEDGSSILAPQQRGSRTGRISPRAMEEATAVIAALKDALNDAGFSRLQTYVARFDAQIIPLEGPSGLIIRVQRLLESSAPKVDDRRKRQLLDTFIRVVSDGS